MNVDLDRIDRQILSLLQKDARISNKELAAKVHLAPSTCHGRVQRLQQEAVIRGFHAAVEPEALGIQLQALISVQLMGNPRQRMTRFLKYVHSQDEVVETYLIAGKTDLLLRVAVRDVEHMRQLVLTKLSSRPEVRQIESALVYEHQRADLPDLL